MNLRPLTQGTHPLEPSLKVFHNAIICGIKEDTWKVTLCKYLKRVTLGKMSWKIIELKIHKLSFLGIYKNNNFGIAEHIKNTMFYNNPRGKDEAVKGWKGFWEVPVSSPNGKGCVCNVRDLRFKYRVC